MLLFYQPHARVSSRRNFFSGTLCIITVQVDRASRRSSIWKKKIFLVLYLQLDYLGTEHGGKNKHAFLVFCLIFGVYNDDALFLPGGIGC
jgi:hypothetical protein